MCDWLTDSKRIIIGIDNITVTSRSDTVQIVEAPTLDDMIQSIIGNRKYRGSDPLTMNSKQCSKVIGAAYGILSILERYASFTRTKKVCFNSSTVFIHRLSMPPPRIFFFLDLHASFDIQSSKKSMFRQYL